MRSQGRGLADAVWYGHVTEADGEEIIEWHILGGKSVEQLRLVELLPEHCKLRASRGKSLKRGRATDAATPPFGESQRNW
ncbi:MAG TPA: hypothetical protein VIH75_09260 [Candidatus Sulfotelmatobacter sp.]